MPSTSKTAKTAAQIHAVLGSDEGEVKRIAKELAQELSPADPMSCEVIDGVSDNAADAAGRIYRTIDALLTLPFFGGEKLVWLKNANFLGDSQTGRAEAVTNALEMLVETLNKGISAETKFLISATEIDKRRSFYKQLGKHAKVETHDKLDSTRGGWEEAAMRLVKERAQLRGITFSGNAIELFTMLTGGDTRQIENELEKVDLYLGANRHPVSIDEVRELVPLSRTGVIFELSNAIANRDLRLCLSTVDHLMQQGESAITILLVAIIPTIRNLLIVKDLMDRFRLRRPEQPHFFSGILNRLPAETTEHLPRKKDGGINTYTLGIAAQHAHRYHLSELRERLDDCLAANQQLVTTQLDPKIVISELLIRITASAKPLA